MLGARKMGYPLMGKRKPNRLPIEGGVMRQFGSRVREALGKSGGVGRARDKDGYFVHTHRCRSKSYSSPTKIPLAKIRFVESTG